MARYGALAAGSALGEPTGITGSERSRGMPAGQGPKSPRTGSSLVDDRRMSLAVRRTRRTSSNSKSGAVPQHRYRHSAWDDTCKRRRHFKEMLRLAAPRHVALLGPTVRCTDRGPGGADHAGDLRYPPRFGHGDRPRAQRALVQRLARAHKLIEEPHPDGTGYAVVLGKPDWSLCVGLHTHPTNARDQFSETRTGLDHVGFSHAPVAVAGIGVQNRADGVSVGHGHVAVH
jgi:hypothetical protein